MALFPMAAVLYGLPVTNGFMMHRLIANKDRTIVVMVAAALAGEGMLLCVSDFVAGNVRAADIAD